jgi:hypothetical protein
MAKAPRIVMQQNVISTAITALPRSRAALQSLTVDTRDVGGVKPVRR